MTINEKKTIERLIDGVVRTSLIMSLSNLCAIIQWMKLANFVRVQDCKYCWHFPMRHDGL